MSADEVPDTSTVTTTTSTSTSATAGLTIADVARRYRVKRGKVRAWINRGELRAINTALEPCSKERWVILPDALAEFERRRASGPLPKVARRRRPITGKDYYPD